MLNAAGVVTILTFWAFTVLAAAMAAAGFDERHGGHVHGDRRHTRAQGDASHQAHSGTGGRPRPEQQQRPDQAGPPPPPPHEHAGMGAFAMARSVPDSERLGARGRGPGTVRAGLSGGRLRPRLTERSVVGAAAAAGSGLGSEHQPEARPDQDGSVDRGPGEPCAPFMRHLISDI